MSILPKETIKVLAEAAGVANLRDDIAAAVAPDVEYRLREVIQESIKFMRHGKRQKLTTDDVDRALRVHSIDPLYGFGVREPLRFRKLPVAGGADLYYIEDEELDCLEVVNAPLPPIPQPMTYTSHWLAIEGVQPAIPQNPLPQELETSLVVATGAPAASLPVIPAAEKATPAAAEGEGTPTAAADSAVPEGLIVMDATAAGAQVKPLVKHVLSREMQTYYEKITSAVLRPDPGVRRIAYGSLRADPGLHQLVPYLVQFVADKVTKHLKDVDVLSSLMAMVRALTDNPNLFLEPYLHQLMPAVLTCIVGKQLCRNPATDDHWSLRDSAATLMAAICRKYGDAYSTLQPRVVKTLLRAFLDPLKPLGTHYGAIQGLAALGPVVIQSFVLPNVEAYMKLLEPHLQPDSTNPVKALEARRCHSALLMATALFYRARKAATVDARLGPLEPGLDETLSSIFGDALAHLVAAPAVADADATTV